MITDLLFPSKNKKLVSKWKKEHEKMVELAHKVIAEYVKNNPKGAKKHLRTLSAIAADHLADEEIEFYKMLNDPKRNDPQTREEVGTFQRTFKEVKPTLMKFLSKYSRDEEELDETFFDTFNSIVEVLAQRIEFEETHLYFRMSLG
jgi:hypothetical protein